MKGIIIVLIALVCVTAFASCKKEDNPAVQASYYVSEESSELDAIGREKEEQLSGLDAAIAEETE